MRVIYHIRQGSVVLNVLILFLVVSVLTMVV